MTIPLETYRWHREHIRPDAFMARPFIEIFDYAESLQQALATEQHARWGVEQDRQHYEERCQDLLGLCLDCWLQFSYLRADYSRHAGGHSTLEALEVELREAGLIDEQGRAVKR